jgi:ABC-type phosphate transport system auxiliary subunit
METNQCNAHAFLQFLQYTLDQYPDKHVVMVLDNANIHHAKVLQPFLQEHEEQLTLVFLPPNRLETKMQKMGNQLRTKMKQMVENLEEKINERFNRLETKVDSLRTELSETQETVDFLSSKTLQHERKIRELYRQQ